ncbi:membrane protein insertase YidC [Geoalkalibacter halelectricus]|uniref:Membrane protein insertase YidC n=1 Tax=Geoalkalibacter halelectricus TaxID=2847045 RepID=A0ABY5ZFW2_9BACT|nr:membrane protein insertase YidC [Geoalkalibacter halelectricus]MDO3378217.1 membrane protein insertase YidC [Geoalkalibacter halelectricus]UWZ78060.1 membrane protein insertase YidC [Geoalkalibacter halelectricus]
MENKNTLIAILLMLVVWIGFTVLYPPPTAPPVTDEDSVVASAETRAEAPDRSLAPVDGIAPLDPPAVARILEVVTDKVRMEIEEHTATIRRIELLQYQETMAADASPVVVLDTLGITRGTLQLGGTDGFSGANQATFSLVDRPGDTLRLAAGESRELVFQGQITDGVVVRKIITLSGDSYQVPVSVELVHQGASPLSGNISLTLVQPWDESMAGTMYEFVGPSTHAGGKKRKDKVDDLRRGESIYTQDVLWTGFEKKYFFNGLVTLDQGAERARVFRVNDVIGNSLVTPYQTLQPGERMEFEFFAFFGPKDFNLLQSLGHQLSDAVDFGFFGFLARPLLHVLVFFNGFLHNFGLAIILLTVIIKILFWPLTQKSFNSMKAMQKLQPEMQKLREKYKEDKQRMNLELMNLYKEHRVNPLGGCLPMLVQIPVFFALYKVLMVSIEMRHAHFFLWITDLSAKDPFYVTPLLMGASMFLQQKLTPTTLDPIQAKIFLAMPIIFTVLFLNFPAGLVLYWLVNNVLTIGQQVMIHRKK